VGIIGFGSFASWGIRDELIEEHVALVWLELCERFLMHLLDGGRWRRLQQVSVTFNSDFVLRTLCTGRPNLLRRATVFFIAACTKKSV
jgi:hypothetical protein